MNKAIFLDRDGTINEDFGYVSKVEKFHFLPNVFDGLKKLLELDFLLIIISNQSGIGRGYYSISDYETVMENMLTQLNQNGIKIHDCFYCPHSPESNCDCRKPGTKMIHDAIKKWDIDSTLSYFIGDKETDIKAGNLCQIKTILISNTEKSYNQTYMVRDILEAAKIIENNIINKATSKKR